MNLQDSIVAVSSPAGAGERAILRLSGPRAVEIAARVFVAGDGVELEGRPTFTALAGRLEPPGSGLSVPATLYIMKAPRSYTRQDVVEFHVGAWPALGGDLVAGLVAAGARPAEAGEFTFRAFAAGRIDLAQAEAVAAVISASSVAALRAAEDLLGGHLSREVAALADEVRQCLALVEADLDFSDQDIELTPPDALAARIDAARRMLAGLGRRARGLETVSGRVRLVVAGRPNAGKSSLFNRLLAAERAIVSPDAGTTRDELRATLHAGGIEFALSDIAGIDDEQPRRGDDDVAGKAREKALDAIGRADLVLLAIDGAAQQDGRLDELMALIAAPVVVAITKCDLTPDVQGWCGTAGLPSRGECCRPSATAGQASRATSAMDGGDSYATSVETIVTSAVTGQGIEELRAALVRAVEGGSVDRQAAGPVLTARHRSALEQAAVALARASRLARRGGGAGELAAVELREALESLGAIIGERAGPYVLELIFSRFCIGK
jgi:tRNA modification GTPase